MRLQQFPHGQHAGSGLIRANDSYRRPELGQIMTAIRTMIEPYWTDTRDNLWV